MLKAVRMPCTQAHMHPYSANLANARALESGLLWLMLTAVCLRFLIYAALPFTLARDRAAASNPEPDPCGNVAGAAADLDAAADAGGGWPCAEAAKVAPTGAVAQEAPLAGAPKGKVRAASTELAAVEAGEWAGRADRSPAYLDGVRRTTERESAEIARRRVESHAHASVGK